MIVCGLLVQGLAERKLQIKWLKVSTPHPDKPSVALGRIIYALKVFLSLSICKRESEIKVNHVPFSHNTDNSDGIAPPLFYHSVDSRWKRCC
ncbi:unnamed protein product [Cylicocyclus nassatus]|uniref:Uncharacterized protein n=1 Tax=Cylicocyclus nassatus TaxID=53992 RepID=A0AA36DR07_CYLNA|nr:unnamed protein product [Cylicocyclus nassatus]